MELGIEPSTGLRSVRKRVLTVSGGGVTVVVQPGSTGRSGNTVTLSRRLDPNKGINPRSGLRGRPLTNTSTLDVTPASPVDTDTGDTVPGTVVNPVGGQAGGTEFGVESGDVGLFIDGGVVIVHAVEEGAFLFGGAGTVCSPGRVVGDVGCPTADGGGGVDGFGLLENLLEDGDDLGLVVGPAWSANNVMFGNLERKWPRRDY